MHVYFGPFDGAARSRATAFHVSRDPMGGLADRFGSTTLVDDFNGDGRADLLVTAPSEGEEGCLGTRASLVYVGPLAPGERSAAESAASVILGAEAGSCLGERAEAHVQGGRRVLLLSTATMSGVRGYALPLGANPTPLAPQETPRFTPEVQPDIDGDRRGDRFERDPETMRSMLRRSSDGAFVAPRYMSDPLQMFALDLDRDGLGAAWMYVDRFDAPSYRLRLTLVRLPLDARGMVDLAATTPQQSGWRSAYVGLSVSRGDLDGDGVDEFAIANAIVRHRRE